MRKRAEPYIGIDVRPQHVTPAVWDKLVRMGPVEIADWIDDLVESETSLQRLTDILRKENERYRQILIKQGWGD